MTPIAAILAYATEHGLTPAEAMRRIVSAGLSAIAAHAKGGRMRAAQMTPEQRSALAKLAARARWNKRA